MGAGVGVGGVLGLEHAVLHVASAFAFRNQSEFGGGADWLHPRNHGNPFTCFGCSVAHGLVRPGWQTQEQP